MMWLSKISSILVGQSLLIFFYLFQVLSSSGEVRAEATLKGEPIQTVGGPVDQNSPPKDTPVPFQRTSDWEKRLFGGVPSKPNFQESHFKSKHSPLLSLKSPGRLPGIELGVEVHSLQAFQSVVPAENLPKGLDLKRDQPLLLPPSINAPDYNGGFLRFTW
jgi:hypothetical protein